MKTGSTSPTSSGTSARKGIQSLETGFRILDVLAHAPGAVALKDIASATGLTASGASFYMVSLLKIGVVQQDGRSGHYRLGPYAMSLGLAGLAQYDLLALAHGRLVDLANQLGHSVFLGVWANLGPTIVYRADGQHSRSLIELRVGSVLPVLRSALGRIFVAHLPSEVSLPFVSRELQEAQLSNPHAPTDGEPDVPRNRIELDRLIGDTRQHGLSRCRRGILSDYTAISAPIFDFGGTIIAAITVMGRIGLLDDNWQGSSAQALRAAARELSQNSKTLPLLDKTRGETPA